MIDCGGRRVIPGLADNHNHVIRGGLNYNMELRWDGVPSLGDAMRKLKEQVARTPAPQWVRVVGGFTEHQFAEKRLPTLDEINAVAPDTPVFILHLYDRALLNAAALRAVGYTKDTPDPPGGRICARQATATRPVCWSPPRMPEFCTQPSVWARSCPSTTQLNSTRHFMRELNRLGVTSVIDAGGGSQNYPDDYAVIQKLHDERPADAALRLQPVHPTPRSGTRRLPRLDGGNRVRAGRRLLPPQRRRGDAGLLGSRLRRLPPTEAGHAGNHGRPSWRASFASWRENRWPWRLHATYDETISRALDVFEKVHRDIPDHRAQLVLRPCRDRSATARSNASRRLSGGIAVQHRMAYQGEYFVQRYGAEAAAAHTPPMRRILAGGVKISAGTDATRVASYDPWVGLSWLVTGRTVGGLRLYPESNLLDRETALRMWTEYPNWFSNSEGHKGQIAVGQLADLAVLSCGLLLGRRGGDPAYRVPTYRG